MIMIMMDYGFRMLVSDFVSRMDYDCSGVVNLGQNCFVGGVGESIYFPAEVGRHGIFELGAELLAKGNEVVDGF